MNKNNDKTLWILLSASLANGVSFSMILPLLAPLIRQLHMTEFQAGLLVSVSALLMSLTAMWISKKAQWQNQFYLLSIGFIGMAITWGLFSAVLSYGVTYSIAMSLLFSLLLVTRASTGVFMAMPQIALQSFVMTSCTEEKQRSQMMAKFGSLNSVGLILGPLVTTLLIGWGILVPMWLAVIILVLMSIVIVCLYPKEQLNHQAKIHDGSVQTTTGQQQKIHQKQETYLQQEGNVVANLKQIKLQQDSINKAIIWLILGFSLYIAIVTLNLTAGFYIQDKFQLSIPQSAIYFSQCSLIVGIALVMMQIAISKWLKWSLQQLLFVGLSSMLLGLGISIVSANIFIFQSAYLFYGIAVACLMPAFTTGAAQSVALNFQTKIANTLHYGSRFKFGRRTIIEYSFIQFDMIFPYYMLIGIFILFSGYFVVLRLKTEKYG